ncbi:MAG: ATP-binding protein [Flavobacteriaceae bacterium]|nr:PAS domain S-box protein [Flavobacteriaceae bacterium]
MNIYITILLEFLLISSSVLLLFRFRSKIGLAPLYILLGAVQYIQAFSGTMINFKVFEKFTIYPGSVIMFCAVLFAVLLIYIKEGVSSARTLIIGIIISNFIISVLFEITYIQEFTSQNLNEAVPTSIFLINYEYFITGTIILLVDFILMVIIYQFLVSKISNLYFFLVLFLSLFLVLIFDSLAFNLILKMRSGELVNSLIGHLIGKSVSALIFSVILYLYLRFIDQEKSNVSFIANQNRDIFSIIRYRKRYLDLKVEKAQVEKKLTSQIESTLNHISDGFVSLDTNWCYTYINIKAGELVGRSPESLMGKHIWTEFPELVNDPFYKECYRASETKGTIYFENYYKPFDKWFESRVYPSEDGLAIYFTDITEKRQAETNNQMLLSLIETSDDFIGLATLEGKPVYLNAKGRQLVGLDIDEDLPNSVADFFPENYRDSILNKHFLDIHDSNKWNGEVQFKNFKTGNLIPIEMSSFLIRDNITNEPIALGNVATDITERKRTETELKKHKNNLEELVELRTSQLEKEKIKAQSADLMKSAFLATMSHELRTPMNSIIGFTGILLKEYAGPLNEEQKKQLSMVKTSGQHLLGLINDILDISKIEAGKLKVSFAPFNYLTTLEKTIDFLSPQAVKKGLVIETEITELEIIINSDERRVEQVLLNLLSNAIKFSEKGTILVKVDIIENLLVTQIIDQGIGISKKDLNKLFMPFIQLNGGLNRTHEGTGLGLAICKSLITKLGGSIHVKSKKGEGSNFTFKLPIQ